MAQAGNQEMYKPTEKEQAFHPMPGYPRAFQCWYHDAIFDNGYNAVISWDLTEQSARISLRICDPNGAMTEVRQEFVSGAVRASTDSLDITMGSNRMSGRFPRYEMHFRNGDNGCDLVYDCVAPAVREPPDSVCIGRERAPSTPVFMGYVYRPRCKVTGTLTVAGRDIPVSGEGYADHQWNNTPVQEALYYWYWGKLHLPDHTLVWWDGMTPEKTGSQRIKLLVALRGDRLLKYYRDARLYVDSGDLDVDQNTGVIYPGKVTLFIDEDNIKGTAVYTRKRLIMKAATRPATPRTMFSYFRYLSDVDVRLNIGGEHVEAKTQAIHEAAI